jgi:uncharacterized membrane protein HdeD (DUF308 family)
MVCDKCGEVNTGTKVCTKCGAKLSDDAPGTTLLKVTGILFIVFAVIALISLVVTSVLLPTLSEVMDVAEIEGMDSLQSSIILGIIGGILNLLAGIFGIKYSKDLEKAILLMCFASVIIAYVIVQLIITYSTYNQLSWTSFIGFVLPGLFLVGAYMNYKAKEGNKVSS